LGWGRRAILRLAGSAWVNRCVRRYGPAFGVRRFVAGETLDDALAAVAALGRLGIPATLDRLGESAGGRDAAAAAADAYVEVLDAVAAAGVESTVSLKLTQMGLDLDPGLCRENLLRVLERARAHGNFVRIDMEDSSRTEATLGLYRRLRAEGWHNVGVVIQAYLYRSLADLESLDALAPNVRLVKGAYDEPRSVAFARRADVDGNFRRLIERQLRRGFPTAVATHDLRIIEFTRETADRLGVPPEGFEFQMLYGIRVGLQRRLRELGHRVRVYVPFGADWYPYLMRRLAERPANVMLVARNLFRA
jgi:proline dehydrogenase